MVNAYVPTQAAVPVHCYDPDVLVRQPLPGAFFTGPRLVPLSFVPGGQTLPVSVSGPDTPNIYLSWLASQAVATRVNFFNVNDYALSRPFWETDQALKPDSSAGPHAQYGYTGNINIIQDLFFGGFSPNPSPPPDTSPNYLHLGDANNVLNRYEIMAFAAEPRCRALGARANVDGAVGFGTPTDLQGVWITDPTGQNFTYHRWHSAQFRFTNADQKNYWKTLLGPSGFNLP